MEHFMVYNFSITTSASFPYSVTKVTDMIAAICHRNDTPRVLGERGFGPNTPGYVIPVSHAAMAMILGSQLAYNFRHVRNDAVHGYFLKVVERLQGVGIHIAYSPSCWFIAKLPSTANEVVAAGALYTTRELLAQRPNGLPLEDAPEETKDPED
jgi:hypothetical protein